MLRFIKFTGLEATGGLKPIVVNPSRIDWMGPAEDANRTYLHFGGDYITVLGNIEHVMSVLEAEYGQVLDGNP